MFRKANEIDEPEPTVQDYLMRGIELDDNRDSVVEETTDEDESIVIGKIKSFFFDNFNC